MSKLKPCPFCGGEAKVFASDGSGAYWSTNVGTVFMHGRVLDHKIIRCTKCGISTKTYLTDKGVWNAWNRRVSE